MAKVDAAVERAKLYRTDFETFASQCLKLRDKASEIVPFRMNAAQKHIHDALERQRAEKGYVRALVLKARQQGCSTYVEGRFYWRTSLWKNQHAFILSHEQTSADALFQMVDRYHRLNPLAPSTGRSNVKELVFDKMGSKYVVATAGSKGVGRGQNNTLFHGSEVAYWKSDTEHFASSVQTVALLPGTEVVLESTANGPSGEFWKKWQDAVAGVGDYIAVFIPWFWSPEYRRELPEHFELSDLADEGEMSEVEYAKTFELDLEQMCWRRYKIQELGSVGKFKQEYPATADEAFQSADKSSLISPLTVLRARKRHVEASGPLIIGVDPAGDGGDRFAIAWRRGHRVTKVEYRRKITEPEALQWVKDIIRSDKPAAVFIDSGGIGRYLGNFLKASGPEYAAVTHMVNFGAKSQAKHARPKVAGPKNRRAEMYERLNRWLESEEGVQIPDRDDIQADMTAVTIKPTMDNDLLLTSKVEMRAKGIPSSDLSDAIALTFADLAYFSSWSEPAKPDNPYDTSRVVTADTLHDRYTVHGATQTNGWMAF
jgi:hypothetical protein